MSTLLTEPAERVRRRSKTTGGVHLGQDTSRAAKQLAAAILEVLAGTRTPTQAAQTLELSLPRYYQLEARALRGLLQACEPRPKGRQRSSANELNDLRQQAERLQREVVRQQTLVRLAQRSIGLAPPPPTAAKAGKKSRKRKPVRRALAIANRLRHEETPPKDNDASAAE